MQQTLLILYACGGLFGTIELAAADELPPGLSFREALGIYYRPYGDATFGYATRYGSFWKASDELYRLATEVKSQQDRGFVLLGGGYGYHQIGVTSQLVDNRAAPGYPQLADEAGTHGVPLNSNQRRLLFIASMPRNEAVDYLYNTYDGIIGTKSPNDIGREFCLINLDSPQETYRVIVGGAAARHDWTYYGESINDNFGHQRLGVRKLHRPNTTYNWIADLTNSVYETDDSGSALIGLLPPFFCECER